MKKILSILLVLSMLFVVIAACADNNETTQPDTPQTQTPDTPAETTPAEEPDDDPIELTDEPVEIRAAWWGDTVRNDMYSSIIDIFEEEFPHVTVIREPVSFGDYWERLAVQVAGGNAPDFLGMHFGYLADYAPRGVMAPLQPFVDAGVISFDGWSEYAHLSGYFDGTLYMMMMGFGYWTTFVNESLFEEIGVAQPEFGWTWDDFQAKAREVRAAFDARGENNSWLSGDPSGHFLSFRAFLRQRGLEIYDEQGDFGASVQDLADWWTLWDDMRKENLIPDPATNVEFAGATLEDSMFSRQRVAVGLFLPSGQISLYSNTFPDRTISLVRNPTLPGGLAGEVLQGAWFAINGQSPPERQLAAAQLMNFWLNDERALAIFRLDQGVPGNLAQAHTYLDQLTDPQRLQLAFIESVDTYDKLPDRLSPEGHSELEGLFTLRAEEVAFGMKTPMQAAEEFLNEFVEVRARASS